MPSLIGGNLFERTFINFIINDAAIRRLRHRTGNCSSSMDVCKSGGRSQALFVALHYFESLKQQKTITKKMAIGFSFRAFALTLLATSSSAFTGSSNVGPRPAATHLSMSEGTPEFSLDPKETAFVFIEYQNEFATVRNAFVNSFTYGQKDS